MITTTVLSINMHLHCHLACLALHTANNQDLITVYTKAPVLSENGSCTIFIAGAPQCITHSNSGCRYAHFMQTTPYTAVHKGLRTLWWSQAVKVHFSVDWLCTHSLTLNVGHVTTIIGISPSTTRVFVLWILILKMVLVHHWQIVMVLLLERLLHIMINHCFISSMLDMVNMMYPFKSILYLN